MADWRAPLEANDAVGVLAGRLGRRLAAEMGRAAGAPTHVTTWRAVRSTWGQVRMTLTRSARALAMPGVPGGAVLDPDPALAARVGLAEAAGGAIRRALTPPGARDGAQPDRRQLPDDLPVLVLAFELAQAEARWRLRVCLPAHTLAAVVRLLAEPDPEPGTSPYVTFMRQMAREQPERVADMLRDWLAEDGGEG